MKGTPSPEEYASAIATLRRASNIKSARATYASQQADRAPHPADPLAKSYRMAATSAGTEATDLENAAAILETMKESLR